MNPFRSLFLSLSRMPPVLMLIIILGLAVVVTMLVMGKMTEGEQKLAQERAAHEAALNQKVKVVFAAKDIDEGEIISQEALEEKDVEASKAPVDAFQSTAGVVGGIAAYPITSGTVISQHALRPRGVQIGFEGKIKEGMRALTFGVDNNSGVAGFIAPGSHVDVIAVAGTGAETKTAPVMSDVEVIAVGTTYQKTPGASSANPAGSVTVTCTPEDAQKLIKSIMSSKLYLTLRNEKDHTPIAVVDVSTLFPKKMTADLAALPPPGGALPPPPLPPADGMGGGPAMDANTPPPPPPMHEIELWSGSKKEVLSVPQG